MPRFTQQNVLRVLPNGYDTKAAASEALAQNLGAVSGFATEKYRDLRLDSAAKDAGEAVANKAFQLKAPVTEYARAHNEVVLRGQFANLKNQYSGFLIDSASRNEESPEVFAAESAAYLKQTLKDVPPELKPAVLEDYERASLVYGSKLEKAAIKREVERSMADISTAAYNIEKNAAIAVRDDDLEGAEYNRQQYAKLVIEPLKEAGKFKAAAKAQRDFDLSLVSAGFMGDMADAYQSGKGEAFLRDFRNNPPKQLSPEEHTGIDNQMTVYLGKQKRLEVKAQGEASAAASAEIAKTQAALAAGIGDTEKQIEQMDAWHKQGLVSDGQLKATYTTFYKGVAAEIDRQADLEDTGNKIRANEVGGISKDASEKYFAEYIEQMDGEPSRNQAWASYVTRTRQMPERMAEYVVNDLHSGEFERMESAAKMMDKIDHIPGVIEVLPKSERAYMRAVLDGMRNKSFAEADKLARTITDPNNQTFIKDRETTLRTFRKENDYTELASDALARGDWYGANLTPLNQAQATRELASEFEANYKAGMSESHALKDAANKINRNWSEWQGKAMKYSPDNYYKVNGSTDWVQKDMESTAIELWGAQVPKDATFELRGDEITARGIATGYPSYQLFMIEPGNAPVPVGTRPDDRYIPDLDKERARVKTLHTDELEEAGDRGFMDRIMPASTKVTKRLLNKSLE